MIRRRLVVTGKVQKVSYRAWFVEQARALGLDGWVRNRADCSVEAVVQGPDERVAMIVELARRGSPASCVVDVMVGEDGSGEWLEGFARRPTA